MIPIEAETGRSSSSSARVITPGFRCGRSPVSSSTSRAQRSRYSSVVSQPSARELLARDLVAQLGLVAEREERLAATGRGAGARDREHLVLGQVRALAAARRPRERAVAADVAAERRQRDEDLRRVGDERPGRSRRASARSSSSGAARRSATTRLSSHARASLRGSGAAARDGEADPPEEAADAVRQEEHDEDEDDAEDDRRPARLLGLVDDPAREE